MKLVISLATRGRPQQLLDTIRKSIANWVNPTTLMVVSTDADDPTSLDVLIGAAQELGTKVSASCQPRRDTIAEKWNHAIACPADLYLVAADDDPYTTPGYDQKLLDAAARFPDGIGMVYGHMANLSFSGVVAPTRRLCELMGGKIFPEYFPYWFCDHWTDDLARMIGRISFADVRTDQSRAGKTQELREPAWWATWFDAAYLLRRKQAIAIIDSDEFQEPKWRKDMLKAGFPLVEHRSRWINESVRRDAPRLQAWSGLSTADERYQRVRARAVALIPELLDGMPADEATHYRNALALTNTVPGLQRAFA